MNKTMRVVSLLLLTLFTVLSLQSHSAFAADTRKAGPFALATTFHVGGEGAWDYLTVDSAHRLLFVPRTTHTMVLDAATGKTVADIPGQKRNHGVALVPDCGRGFISDGKDGSVVIFDLKTYAVLGKIKAADDADGIIYDPASRRVLVSCGDANALIAIAPDVDPKSGKVDASVPLGGKPEYLAADGKGKVYVNLENKDLVAVVDTKAMKVLTKWPVAPGGAPVGMAMDTEKHRLYIGCRKPQKLIAMSADNGKVLATLPIGAGVDATKLDDGYILASCRDGKLTVARETPAHTFEIVQTVDTALGARTMDVDPATHEIFLPTADFVFQVSKPAGPVAKTNSFMIVVVRPFSGR